ncbi:hypothetical protein SDC9_135489 [bioreactor metagenome]|uniref:Uncharacterized protein n=1 Tax=bioreactor metagenome TaxID=1076179 RepID=A0A645DGC0_9ZZZZ
MPMIRLMHITIPKCSGSMPTAFITGRRTGTKMMIAAVVSITIPTINSNILISSNKIYLLVVIASKASAIIVGI